MPPAPPGAPPKQNRSQAMKSAAEGSTPAESAVVETPAKRRKIHGRGVSQDEPSVAETSAKRRTLRGRGVKTEKRRHKVKKQTRVLPAPETAQGELATPGTSAVQPRKVKKKQTAKSKEAVKAEQTGKSKEAVKAYPKKQSSSKSESAAGKRARPVDSAVAEGQPKSKKPTVTPQRVKASVASTDGSSKRPPKQKASSAAPAVTGSSRPPPKQKASAVADEYSYYTYTYTSYSESSSSESDGNQVQDANDAGNQVRDANDAGNQVRDHHETTRAKWGGAPPRQSGMVPTPPPFPPP